MKQQHLLGGNDNSTAPSERQQQLKQQDVGCQKSAAPTSLLSHADEGSSLRADSDAADSSVDASAQKGKNHATTDPTLSTSNSVRRLEQSVSEKAVAGGYPSSAEVLDHIITPSPRADGHTNVATSPADPGEASCSGESSHGRTSEQRCKTSSHGDTNSQSFSAENVLIPPGSTDRRDADAADDCDGNTTVEESAGACAGEIVGGGKTKSSTPVATAGSTASEALPVDAEASSAATHASGGSSGLPPERDDTMEEQDTQKRTPAPSSTDMEREQQRGIGDVLKRLPRRIKPSTDSIYEASDRPRCRRRRRNESCDDGHSSPVESVPVCSLQALPASRTGPDKRPYREVAIAHGDDVGADSDCVYDGGGGPDRSMGNSGLGVDDVDSIDSISADGVYGVSGSKSGSRGKSIRRATLVAVKNRGNILGDSSGGDGRDSVVVSTPPLETDSEEVTPESVRSAADLPPDALPDVEGIDVGLGSSRNVEEAQSASPRATCSNSCTSSDMGDASVSDFQMGYPDVVDLDLDTQNRVGQTRRRRASLRSAREASSPLPVSARRRTGQTARSDGQETSTNDGFCSKTEVCVEDEGREEDVEDTEPVPCMLMLDSTKGHRSQEVFRMVRK